MRKYLWLLLALLAATGMSCYVERVLAPMQQAEAMANGEPGDHLGDLYHSWFGARELLHRRDPYSSEATRQLQVSYYGRALYPEEHRDQHRFAYPVYVAFVLAPLLWMPFPVVQMIVIVLLGVATAASVVLWLRFFRWGVPPVLTAALILFTLSSTQVIEGLRLRQPGMLVGFLLAASAMLARKQRLSLAGSLLALSTIKPQMALLPVGWWLFWASSQWAGRKRLVWGFTATMALLVGGGELILPGWVSRFLNTTAAYREYAPGLISPLQFLAGPTAGMLLGGVLLGMLGVICWRSRREAVDSSRFALVLSLVLVTAMLAMPIMPQFNQILLLPVVLLVLRDWSNLWRASRLSCLLFIGVICWPWITAYYVLLFSPRVLRLPLLASFLLTLIIPLMLARHATEILRGQRS